MPSSFAFWFIRLTNSLSVPAICSAIATDASFPEATTIHLIIVSTVCFSPSSRKTWDPPILLACALVVTSSVSWSVPFSSSSKISSSVMIFVMLAGLRCSDAFFSYRTVPVCASIKRTDGEASPRSVVISGAVSSVSSVFCSVVSFCCLSEDSPFCSAAITFKGAARSARIISRLQTIFRVLLFIFPRNICSFFPTGYADDRRTMLSVPFTAAVPETSAHRGVHGLQNFSFDSSPY